MLILGFQKMTLLDFPNKVACTVFTGGCNMRCPFCHNALLVTEIDPKSAYDEREILSFISKRKGLLDGVAITGGEPLLQSDIKSFIKEIKDMGFLVKLDTNGTFPDKLEELLRDKLVDYVAMDVKNRFEKYGETTGVKNFDVAPVKRSMDILIGGDTDFEFRTTVVKEFHEVEDIKAIAEEIKGAKRYYLQNFVDSGNLISGGLGAVSEETLKEMRREANEILPTFIRGV